jgi:hypothetical protein
MKHLHKILNSNFLPELFAAAIIAGAIYLIFFC